jgi:hypothetical protein
VARATADLDLLALDPACLDPSTWRELRGAGASVEIRRGDDADPLAGVVRVSSPGERPVDLVVGKVAWQASLLSRATPLHIGIATVRVVGAADLVLLKLYAGGPQDAWDVEQLLALDPSIAHDVEARLPALPDECAALWRRIRAGSSGAS